MDGKPVGLEQVAVSLCDCMAHRSLKAFTRSLLVTSEDQLSGFEDPDQAALR